MTPELWKRAKELLAAAQELETRDRESFVDEACQDDVALREEVAELLEYEEPGVGILDIGLGLLRPPESREDGGLDDSGAGSLSALHEGQRVGPYEVERVLAEGGMGTVALAVREDDFSKQVALKLIKPEKLSEDLLRRFQMERQILASLAHPNIAVIHDGGTTEDGLPYFAMEYVEGVPIDRYCDAGRLSIRWRLELFLKVCSAVEVAHHNLVVHRDLKPGNILVTAAGVPKLIDFGIAKPLGAELAAKSLATAPGTTPMTVKYASPEQVRGKQINTATDIYSLGVLLFELLTGEAPYPLDSSSVIELARVICEEEPQKPSSAIRHRQETHSADSADARQTAATPSRNRRGESRTSDTRRISRRLAGDLDSIVLKALRKDRRNRYSSVEQFSEDIRRHLAGLPVIAREGTFVYRAGKYLRRNRRWLATASFLLLVVLASAMMKIRADRQIERVKLDNLRAENQANMLSGLLKNLFIKAFNPDEAQGGSLTASEVLDRGRELITADLEGEPELLAMQLEAMGMVYEELGRYDRARPLLADSLRLRRRFYNGDHPLLARGLNNMAACFYRAGDDRRAEILYREALWMRRRLGQEDIDLAKPMSNLATILMNLGKYEEAEEEYRRVLESRERVYGCESTDVATSLFSLGTLFYVRGDFEAAEAPLRKALGIRSQAFGPEHTKVASARSTLGRILHAQGRLEEAEEHFAAVPELLRKRLGEDHIQVAFTKRDLAALRLDQGDPAAAELLLAPALRVFRQTKPEGSWVIADAESLLGACLTTTGRYEEAEALLHRSYRILREQRSERAIYTRKALSRLHELYAAWHEREAPGDLPPNEPITGS
ncbi:MAG: serine/threonine protein kinase [bacterium]|nr:serine/threonine protein kinase [bacterium]